MYVKYNLLTLYSIPVIHTIAYYQFLHLTEYPVPFNKQFGSATAFGVQGRIATHFNCITARSIRSLSKFECIIITLFYCIK